MTRRGKPLSGLASRLFVVQIFIVLTGTATLLLTVSLLGPVVFRTHLDKAGLGAASATRDHVQEAFRDASALAIGVAVLAELAVAFAISLVVSRRIGRSVGTVASAAHALAAGDHQVRIPAPGLGVEFDQLAEDFNVMASRLDAVEQTRRRLLGDLAHEMRTPLATLDAHLEAIEDGVRRFDGETVALLQAQTSRLTRLAEDVADVSRAEEGQIALAPRPVPVGRLLDSAAATQRDRYAAAGVALTLESPSPTLLVQADPDRLHQVLGNVLDNALRHTPRGGVVALGASAADGRVTLTVRDTGEGIASEHVERVFERFYRVDPARDRTRGGSGIGLAISRALVQAHGGTIQIVSPGPGQGTTVTITLAGA